MLYGDKIAVISPSGPLRELDNFQQGLEIWRSHGYQIEFIDGWDGIDGYLSASDCKRRDALAQAWQDPQIKAIACSRGGYGTMRLLEDFSWPKGISKWLIGFSDITGLIWSLQTKGISSIHGPVLTTLSLEPDWSIKRLFALLEGSSVQVLMGKGWGNGKAKGKLIVGNLTVATALLGTEHQPDFAGVILGFEDVGESPYRIDRMLTQWRLTGALTGIKGIVLGRFSQSSSDYQAVEKVLRDRLGNLPIPIVSDLPFGHDGVNAALKVGSIVELDGDLGQLREIC